MSRNASRRFVIGVDLGGTHIRAAAIDFQGRILSIVKRPTRAHVGRLAVIATIKQAAMDAVAALGATPKAAVALGIGFPGPLNTRTGMVHKAPNLPFEKVPLRSILARAFGIPVVLENDANAAVWGEKWRGAGRGYKDIVMLTLGTGIGGGIILGNKLWRGVDDTAAEIGHMTLFPDGIRCNCGNRGCVEAYASANATARRAREAVQSGQKTILLKLAGGDIHRITSALVHQAVLNGDPVARRIMKETGEYLGTVIAALVNLLNPEAVILGGGLSNAGKWLFDPVRRTVKARAFPHPAARARIIPARLGEDAGVIGAAGNALEVLGIKYR